MPTSATTIQARRPTEQELAFVHERRVGHLATADAQGRPSVVPICYAVVERGGAPEIVSVLDEKPKRVDDLALRRVRNIVAQPAVALVIDDYDEDWQRLAFVQIKGEAALVQPGGAGHDQAIAALRKKYPQYAAMAIESRPVIRMTDLTATSWRAGGPDAETIPNGRLLELESVIRGRRSVRAFTGEPVPRAVIERAIEAAGWAPSPHGRQPWRFAVVESADRKLTLTNAMAATWQEQLELDGQDTEIVQTRLRKSRERLLTAPILLVPCLYLEGLDDYPDPGRQEAEATMAVQSIGAAIQNLLLMIHASGYDAGWMCAPLFCPDVVRDALGLDAALIPHALITVGRAAKDPIRRPRLPLDDLIVSWT
ncbi:MAG TPA: TIGR03668 family PPOX class F420-dependent oxidoreductase [Thermomicrobiales bacterium]|nr:TIGR03668 family PPOX class F420-dependent oxidoreductase [Thermomicrobiales bacterium]